MAEVRITIGPLSVGVTIDNAVAEKYARRAAALGTPDSASDQEKLQAVVHGAVDHIHRRAMRQAQDDAVRQAETDFERG